MDASQPQDWVHYIRPNSESSQTFEDILPSPLYDKDQSSNMSGGFSHTPLEHEVVASGSVWDDSGVSDELFEQHIEISTTLLGQSFPAAPAGTPREYCMDARDPGLDEAVPRSAVLEPCSDLADLPTTGTASAVTLVEEISALDTASEPTNAVNKVLCSRELSNDQSASPPGSEIDLSDKLSTSSEHVNNSNGPAELAISISPARLITHVPIPRAERPEFFEIPIPIFPFPAGTSRCKNRNCPIKIRHEQGPYLHEGKLRTREGSIFGSSNPPPEIWFLHDKSRRKVLRQCRQGFGSD